MSEYWPHWLHPEWLLLLPLLAWPLWRLWHRQRRAGRWELLLPPAFHQVLLGERAGRDSRLPWIALGLAWLLALLALLGPSWQRIEQNPLKRADPLVVLLEVTPGMLAGDAAPNRLAVARRKLLDLLEARQEAQTAVVVYAGSAHTLVPLSDDLEATRNLLDAVAPAIMPVAGRRADLAVARGLELLEQGARGRGQLLLIGTELDAAERQGIVRALGRQGRRFGILGIGSTSGAPIVREDGSLLKDEQGSILLARLDATGLARFAASLGGLYQNATLDSRDLQRLGLLGSPRLLRESEQSSRLEAWADQGHWLLLPLLLLAACAARRGWLLCLLPLLLVLPRPAPALEFGDLWLRRDQQGHALLQAGRPADAALRFEDSQWQGVARYRAGDYAGAAESFARGHSADAHYNRGNALARAGELEAALDAYERALELQPTLQPAQLNKALVEELLRQQQAGQPGETDTGGESAPQGGTQAAAGTSAQAPHSGENGENSEAVAATAAASSPTDEGTGTLASAGDTGRGDEAPTAPGRAVETAAEQLGDERRQALEQWLRQIPDDPGELLRRKFWYEQQQYREVSP